jgi:hypothetical protein
VASVFLSSENYRILDRELKNNFSVSIEELSAQDQRTVEHTIRVEKRKKITVKKVLKEITSVQHVEPDSILIEWDAFKPDKYRSFVGEGGIMLGSTNQAQYRDAVVHREVKSTAKITSYELVEAISRRTHLPCLAVERMLARNGRTASQLADEVVNNAGLVPFVIESVLTKVYRYEETVLEVEEEVELTKMYPFKVSVDQSKNTLIVYKEDTEATYGSNRLGFHVNPYNFDSADEKNLFRYLQGVLKDDEIVADVYFTGGATDPSHNDFYFEYWSPAKQQMARYFPDFLIETSKGRYLVVEVKSSREKDTYEQNRTTYAGSTDGLFDEVFAKEIGFREFQKTNKQFEYRIVFDASLQARQQEVLEAVHAA